MSACSSEICAAYSGSGKWDEGNQHWSPVSSWSPACSGEGTRPMFALLSLHRVPPVKGLVCRAT